MSQGSTSVCMQSPAVEKALREHREKYGIATVGWRENPDGTVDVFEVETYKGNIISGDDSFKQMVKEQINRDEIIAYRNQMRREHKAKRWGWLKRLIGRTQ